MTTSKHIIYHLFKMITIGAFLFGCAESTTTPSPNQIDEGPFTGIPCEAPCWHNLIVGESDESDVRLELSKLTFIDQDTIYIHQLSLPSLNPSVYAQGKEFSANCTHSVKQCIRLRVVENVLTEIVTTLNYGINLNEAIEHLGNPDFVGYQDLGAEKVICEIDLIWSDKQLILASEKFQGNDAIHNCQLVRDTHKTLSNLRILEARYVSNYAMNFLLSSGSGEFFEFTGTTP